MDNNSLTFKLFNRASYSVPGIPTSAINREHICLPLGQLTIVLVFLFHCQYPLMCPMELVSHSIYLYSVSLLPFTFLSVPLRSIAFYSVSVPFLSILFPLRSISFHSFPFTLRSTALYSIPLSSIAFFSVSVSFHCILFPPCSVSFHSIPFHCILFHSTQFQNILFRSNVFYSVPVPFQSILPRFRSVPFYSIVFYLYNSKTELNEMPDLAFSANVDVPVLLQASPSVDEDVRELHSLRPLTDSKYRNIYLICMHI